MKKLWKTYLQVITDFCVKIAALEISVVETFKNISTVGVHCGYIKDAVVRFHQQIFEKKKKKFRRHVRGWLLSLQFKVYLKKFITSP